MIKKSTRPVLREQADLDFGISRAAISEIEYNPQAFSNQPALDVVALLARRTGVDPVTIRAHVEAWNFGEGRQ